MPGYHPDARGLLRSAEPRAIRRDTAPGMAGRLPLVDGAAAQAGASAARPAVAVDAKREKIARTATNRNMMLLFLGHSARVPQCEKEGTADPKARKAYLCGVPCAFTKSDRSMAVQAATGEWHLAVDEWWQPAVYATKAAALAAGRRAEQRHDALAKVAPPPAGMVGARARASWRKADRARGLDRAEERRYAY